MNSSDSALIYNAKDLLDKYDPTKSLDRFFSHLARENKRVNLVSRETISGDRLTQLAAESLAVFETIPSASVESYLDIGSGGGFPAVPILLTHSVARAVLVERTQKKASALRRILLALGVKATILATTFETTSFHEDFDLVTLRLVRLTQPLFTAIMAAVKPGGRFLYYAASDFPTGSDRWNCSSGSYRVGRESHPISYTLFVKT
ncbi:MAG: class I SAM-dependent methyltransferase [candidate division Zixibacteria bacterium]|nr:class I SAM-dependent methyltransferase [candidate division Zixibacteria bacterium]